MAPDERKLVHQHQQQFSSRLSVLLLLFLMKVTIELIEQQEEALSAADSAIKSVGKIWFPIIWFGRETIEKEFWLVWIICKEDLEFSKRSLEPSLASKFPWLGVGVVGVLWSEQSVEPLAARKLDCAVIFLLSPKFSPTFSPITIPPLIGLSVRGFGKNRLLWCHKMV